MTKTKNRIRSEVFWPSFGLLLTALIFSQFNPESFLSTVSYLNTLLLTNFGWLFSITALSMVLICAAVWFSPLGKIRIGGPDAKPILSRWRWFSITLCTTIATGILFWGTAEPLYHFSSPPGSSGLLPKSEESAEFAMSTMFLHWTLTPYAIYSLPTMAFALAFYNRNAAFSLSSMVLPYIGWGTNSKFKNTFSSIVDVLCLFALVAGMSASLGTGILTLAGGLESVFGFEKNYFLLFFICAFTVAAFIISASSGLMKGIRILSSLNVYAFIGIAVLIFAFGPVVQIFNLSFSGLSAYFSGFFEKNLYNVIHPDDSWADSWTVFFWANWMAWAPISAMFLGRIARGYTVRELLLFNWILPSLFSMLWMSIFSGTALGFQLSGKIDLLSVLDTGYESVIYAIMDQLSLGVILPLFFIFIVFLSYVTAADSNTEAMGALSMTGITAESASPPVYIKIIWGTLIGATAFVMVSSAGVEGIKMLSNLGGFPALILLSSVMLVILRLLILSFNKKNNNV